MIAPATRTSRRIVNDALRADGIAPMSANVAKKPPPPVNTARIKESFDVYASAVHDLQSRQEVTAKHIGVHDETFIELTHASLLSGREAMLVHSNTGRATTAPGLKSGPLPSLTFTSMVFGTGDVVAYCIVVKRSVFHFNDFNRREGYLPHPINTTGEATDTCAFYNVQRTSKLILIIGNESGKFTTRDYHLWIEFALRRARAALAVNDLEWFILVHDNAPAHGDTEALLRICLKYKFTLVTLAGGVTPMVQLHDVGLFGGFKSWLTATISAIESVSTMSLLCLNARLRLEPITHAHAQRIDAMIERDDRAGLAADLLVRLRSHDASMSLKELTYLCVAGWQMLYGPAGTKSERMVELMELVGYFPLDEAKWMKRAEEWDQGTHRLIRKQRHEKKGSGGGEVLDEDTAAPPFTPRPVVNFPKKSLKWHFRVSISQGPDVHIYVHVFVPLSKFMDIFPDFM